MISKQLIKNVGKMRSRAQTYKPYNFVYLWLYISKTMGRKSLKTVQKARLKTSILKKRLSPHNIKLDKNPQSNST